MATKKEDDKPGDNTPPPENSNPPKSADLVKESADLHRQLAALKKEMEGRNESQDNIIAALQARFDLFKTEKGSPVSPPVLPGGTPEKADFWGWFRIPGL